MNAKELRILIIAISLTLMLAAVTPTLSIFIRLPSGSKKYSELWLLGPTHKAEDFPSNVVINQNYDIYVTVENHLGYSAYYRIDVKLRNETQPLPQLSNSTPSPLDAVYEFQLFLRDSETWEAPVTFSLRGEPSLLDSIVINGIVVPVDSSSIESPEPNGFLYQLFFELWLYSDEASGFQYHNRYVGIWLNATNATG